MDKEDVLLEIVNDEDFEEVSVIPYDIHTKTIISAPIETISRGDAMSRYNIVGEIICGETRIYDDYETDEFPEFDEEE